MTFRRQMTIIVIAIVFIAIMSNSFISGHSIDRYFTGYVEGQYKKDIIDVENYAFSILEGEVDNLIQANIELRNYLSDVIISIGIFDTSNRLIVAVREESNSMPEMMRMNMLATDDIAFTIYQDNQVIGFMKIEKVRSIANTQIASIFRFSMIRTIALSGAMTLFLSIILIGFISKRMTRDLKNTALMAERIDTFKNLKYNKSKIKEINAIQNTLIDLATKLKLKESLRKERADRLAHEARTPLTILKSSIEGVKDGIVEFDDKRLELWMNEVDRLTVLVENIGDIIDFDKNSIEVNKSKLNINSVVEKVVLSMKPQFQQKGIKFTYTLNNEETFIESDENLIMQSIYNLLSNACKYTNVNGIVDVMLSSTRENIVLKVSDNGYGMSDDDILHAFKAYYRGDNSTEVEGIGMGLYIVKENMKALGGNVSVYQNKMGGMTFKLEVKKS